MTRYPCPVLTLLSGSSLFGALAVDCFTWVAGALAAAPGRLGALGARVEATVMQWGWVGSAGEMADRQVYTPARIALAVFLVVAVAAVAALVSSVVTRRSGDDAEVRAPRRG